MTCGKLHILCAPPAAPDTRTRTGRAGEGKGAPDGGRAGGDAGDARGSGPDDPGPSAAPEDAGDARVSGPGGTRTTGRPAGADAGENPANDKNDKSFS